MKRIALPLVFLALIAVTFTSCGDMAYESSKSPITDSYSSEESAYNENDRKVVKTAQISLNVDHLEQSIIQLKSFLKPIKGYVYNYQIENHSYQTDQYQKNMDSTVSVQKVTPEGNLSVRIPIAVADSFINFVLNGNAQIASLKISDDDITENLWEKKQIANVYDGSKKTIKKSNKQIAYNNNTAIDAIKAKALAAKMDYKTKYLWFDINMSAKPFYETNTTIAAKNYRTPIHIAFANAIVTGWHICEDIILALVTIWPVLLLLGLVLFMIRRYRLRAS